MPIQLDIHNMHKFRISVVMSGAFNTESWPVKVYRLYYSWARRFIGYNLMRRLLLPSCTKHKYQSASYTKQKLGVPLICSSSITTKLVCSYLICKHSALGCALRRHVYKANSYYPHGCVITITCITGSNKVCERCQVMVSKYPVHFILSNRIVTGIILDCFIREYCKFEFLS